MYPGFFTDPDFKNPDRLLLEVFFLQIYEKCSQVFKKLLTLIRSVAQR